MPRIASEKLFPTTWHVFNSELITEVNMKKETERQKLEKKLKKHKDCLVWTGCKDKDGYGKIQINKKHYRTHRLAYEITYGEIPKGKMICHKCSNKACCNEKHLYVGDAKINANDREKHGHNAFKGERNPKVKLTIAEVILIRDLYKSGNFSCIKLGKKFGISREHIYSIVKNKTWKHIK